MLSAVDSMGDKPIEGMTVADAEFVAQLQRLAKVCDKRLIELVKRFRTLDFWSKINVDS